MIADLAKYETYKPTGSKWLGNVPSHWDLHSLRNLTQSRSERNRPELTLLSVERERGVIVRDREKATNHNFIPDDLSNYKVAKQGDLVINKMKAWQGSMGIAPCDGIVSPAYYVFRFRFADRAFAHRLLRSKPYVAHFAAASDGVRVGQWDLSIPGMRNIPIIVPPPDEQELIVRFLDWASVRLGKAIEAKRKVIGLLEEQKQAIIHRAVTRGLDDTVPLKPSGLDWLGDVPEHWDVLRAGALFAERKQSGVQGLPMLVVSLNTGVTLAGDLDHRGREKRLIADVTKYSLARSGDIAYNMMRLWQGAVGVVPEDGLVSPAYVVATPRVNLTNSSFYELVFRTDECKGEINRQSRGIVPDRNRMYWDSFKQLKLPVPPLDEQAEIVGGVQERFQPILTTVNSLRNEIRLLQEYRTRLIADVVTGKLDVREFARMLPADIAEEAAELASTELGDDEYSEADDELVEEPA